MLSIVMLTDLAFNVFQMVKNSPYTMEVHDRQAALGGQREIQKEEKETISILETYSWTQTHFKAAILQVVWCPRSNIEPLIE